MCIRDSLYNKSATQHQIVPVEYDGLARSRCTLRFLEGRQDLPVRKQLKSRRRGLCSLTDLSRDSRQIIEPYNSQRPSLTAFTIFPAVRLARFTRLLRQP